MIRGLPGLEARFIRAPQPVPTVITRPGKTARSKPIVLKGRILGAMHVRGQVNAYVHHYRVEGADGVLYLCPPHWLPNDPLGLTRGRLEQMEEIVALLQARKAARDAASKEETPA